MAKEVSSAFQRMGSGNSKNSFSSSSSQEINPELCKKARDNPKTLTDEEWKEILSPVQYNVARNNGTERAFTGSLYDVKEPGVYYCVCCSAELFNSNTKYDSGSGWPSFYDTAKNTNGDNILKKKDISLGMPRVEVLCKRCDAHLGHVFTDGPQPTGLRYCINSASLRFKKDQ